MSSPSTGSSSSQPPRASSSPSTVFFFDGQPSSSMAKMGGAIDMLAWDGTVSASDFFYAACAFIQRWERNNLVLPPWSWIPSPKQPFMPSNVEGYLSLENICLLRPNEEEHDRQYCLTKEDTSCSKSEEPQDTAALAQSDNQNKHLFDFHIVYSASYKVPVLYFRAYYSDGQPLSIDEILKVLPSDSRKMSLDSKWMFITQEEHPYLQRPWHKLHPCGTGEWIKLLFVGDASSSRNGLVLEQYLISWLSVVGQVVGLRVPLELLKY